MPKKKATTSMEDTVTQAINKPRVTKTAIPRADFLSTGSTLLNLAFSGYPEGGFWAGGYFYIVGDTSSGKTFLTRTCLAEATINPRFKDYRLIFDDIEGGALMDTLRYFGQGLVDRLEPPQIVDGKAAYSFTIEDLYFNLDDAIQDGRPFIYVADSMDALSSKYEGRKFQEKKVEGRGGRKAKGDYGDGKAKMNSSGIRQMLAAIRKSGSIIILISQTRDNIDAGLFESKKTRSGGKALAFYADLEMWSSVGKAISKDVRGKPRLLGITSRIRIHKNRSTGRQRVVEVPILYSHGIDDIGGCVDFLIEENHWKKADKGGMVDATADFGVKKRTEDLIRYIQDNNLEFDLRQLVAEVWEEIEVACEVTRKPRY